MPRSTIALPKIGIDIDSTLYDFEIPLRQAYLDLALAKDDKDEYFKGGYTSWVEWRSPADVCGWDAFSEALAVVHSSEVILTRQPFANAVEVVKEIAEKYDITYISNRAPDTYEPTAEWLTSNGFPFEDHHELVCTMDDKMGYLGTCQYIIDDRPKTLVEFVYNWNWKFLYGSNNVEQQRKGFGLLFEYNRALTDIPNVYLAPTWAGLRYYLQEKGVL